MSGQWAAATMRGIYLLLALLALALGVMLLNWRGWPEYAVAESQRRGDIVIAAVKAFRADQNRYPSALSELLPRYLQAIEPPTVGDGQWIYESNPSGYYLGFKGGKDDPKSWRSNMDVDDANPETRWHFDEDGGHD